MQEIGTWTTSSGSVSAILEFESDGIDGDGEKMPQWLGGALQGAAAGAATGAAAGPYGALIGAAAGGVIGGASAHAASQQTKPPSSSAPAPASSTSSAPKPGATPSAAQANVIQALQQFASVIPALVQLVAASGKGGKEADLSNGTGESIGDVEWGPESFEGSWTVP